MVSHPHLVTQRTALYRLYDNGETLLYIGITHDLEARWKAHAATKAWWPEVAREEVEWHADRLLAEAAEVAAIRTELPVHNVDDSPIAPRLRTLMGDEVTASGFKAAWRDVIQRAGDGEIIWGVGRDRARTREAAVVPVDLGELIQGVGGVDSAVAILKAAKEENGDR